jgi:hypothetical protein
MWDQQVQRRVSGVFIVGVDGINTSIEGEIESAVGVAIVGIDGIKRIRSAPEIQGNKYSTLFGAGGLGESVRRDEPVQVSCCRRRRRVFSYRDLTFPACWRLLK